MKRKSINCYTLGKLQPITSKKIAKENEKLKANKSKIEELKDMIVKEGSSINKKSVVMLSKVNNITEITSINLIRLKQEKDRLAMVEAEYINVLKDKEKSEIVQANNNNTNKIIKEISTQINKKNIRNNDFIAKIKYSKEKINELRKERTIYDNLYKNLEEQIINKRRDILEYIQKHDDVKKQKIIEENQLFQIKKATKNKDNIKKNEIYNTNNEIKNTNLLVHSDSTNLNNNNNGTNVNAKFKQSIIDKNKEKTSEANEIETTEDNISKVKQLFNEDNLELIKEYYENGEENNDKLLNEILELENSIDSYDNKIKLAKEQLQKNKTSENNDNITKYNCLKSKISKLTEENKKLSLALNNSTANIQTCCDYLKDIKAGLGIDDKVVELNYDNIKTQFFGIYFKPIESFVHKILIELNILKEEEPRDITKGIHNYTSGTFSEDNSKDNLEVKEKDYDHAYNEIINGITNKDNLVGRERENLITEDINTLKKSLILELK